MTDHTPDERAPDEPTTAARRRPTPVGRHAAPEPVDTPEHADDTDAHAIPEGEGPEDAAEPAEVGTGAPSGRGRRLPARGHAGAIALVSGVLTVAVAIVLVVLLVNGGSGSSSPSASNTAGDTVASLTDTTLAQAFVAGATSDIASVSSYSYRTLSSDLDNGEAVTTGAFKTRYREALTGSLGTTARRLHRTQSFDLATAGIGRISADGRTAHVLVFGTQNVKDDTTGGKTHQSLVTLDVTVHRNGDTYLISDLEVGGNAGLPPGTPALDDAAEAAREEVVNLLTTRRSRLAADYAAALALAVDPLRSQLMSQEPSVRSAVTKGGYDLTGLVTAVAVQSADGDTVTMLVAATGTRTTSSGASTVVTEGHYVVTVVRVQGRWLVSAASPVAVS